MYINDAQCSLGHNSEIVITLHKHNTVWMEGFINVIEHINICFKLK
jgi:hypothetical protein